MSSSCARLVTAAGAPVLDAAIAASPKTCPPFDRAPNAGEVLADTCTADTPTAGGFATDLLIGTPVGSPSEGAPVIRCRFDGDAIANRPKAGADRFLPPKTGPVADTPFRCLPNGPLGSSGVPVALIGAIAADWEEGGTPVNGEGDPPKDCASGWCWIDTEGGGASGVDVPPAMVVIGGEGLQPKLGDWRAVCRDGVPNACPPT